MLGGHMVKSWSGNQAVIALSSGEAEYYAMVRAASVAIGLRSIMMDLGVKLKIELFTDATAAKGIGQRIGLGKVRHLETSQLWLQQLVGDGHIRITKISTDINIADVLTKHVDQKTLRNHQVFTNQAAMKGQHRLGLNA